MRQIVQFLSINCVAVSRHGFCAEYLIEQLSDPFTQDRAQQRSAMHYAAAKGKAGALRKLLSDHLCIHTDEGFVPLKSARIQDVSGNCRYMHCHMAQEPGTWL